LSTIPTALRLDDLCKSFGRIRAVDHLSLEVHPGEMVGFLGPNGAGKSTTLYMIAGLVHPSAGTIEVFGHNVQRRFKDAMQHAAAMVETPAFYEFLSGRKNLALVGRLRGNVSESQIEDILNHVGLYDRRNDKVATYSHGMKQRLGLGATMLGNPRLLLLDEPTNGMDPEATREILTLLRERVRNEGLAVFLSSHLLYEVEEYCDRILVINEGRLIASGEVSDILAPDNVVRVTFSGRVPDCSDLVAQDGIDRAEIVSDDSLEITLSSRDAGWLNDYLLRGGYRVSALVPKQKTLKDFFLSITGDQNICGT
jgi:ABC-2 type transport system ATP-binding protein